MDARLDCYAGAYGLTIRIDCTSLDDLRKFRETFRRLSEGETLEVALHRMDGLRVSGLDALTLTLVDADPEVTLRRLHRGTFLWMNTKEGWTTCCGLIDGLIEADTPGHQYLTHEQVDDALVEVTLYERPDEVQERA